MSELTDKSENPTGLDATQLIAESDVQLYEIRMLSVGCFFYHDNNNDAADDIDNNNII